MATQTDPHQFSDLSYFLCLDEDDNKLNVSMIIFSIKQEKQRKEWKCFKSL